jgi:hypothetical protein
MASCLACKEQTLGGPCNRLRSYSYVGNDLSVIEMWRPSFEIIDLFEGRLNHLRSLFSMAISDALRNADHHSPIGICQPRAWPGDIVAFVVGCRRAIVLRSHCSFYVLVGQSFLHGFMNKEAAGKVSVIGLTLVY